MHNGIVLSAGRGGLNGTTIEPSVLLVYNRCANVDFSHWLLLAPDHLVNVHYTQLYYDCFANTVSITIQIRKRALRSLRTSLLVMASEAALVITLSNFDPTISFFRLDSIARFFLDPPNALVKESIC